MLLTSYDHFVQLNVEEFLRILVLRLGTLWITFACHRFSFFILFLLPFGSPVCPREKLGLSLGQTGLPLCKIRRKSGLSQGQSRFVPVLLLFGVFVSLMFFLLQILGLLECFLLILHGF